MVGLRLGRPLLMCGRKVRTAWHHHPPPPNLYNRFTVEVYDNGIVCVDVVQMKDSPNKHVRNAKPHPYTSTAVTVQSWVLTSCLVGICFSSSQLTSSRHGLVMLQDLKRWILYLQVW